MNKYTTVRAAVSLALISAAPAVFAQVLPPDPVVVNQNVNNTGTVSNLGGVVNGSNDLFGGTSATISVSATGAVGSVSVSAINSSLPIPTGGFSSITQTVGNPSGANVNNDTGSIDGGSLVGSLGTLGTGASASVSATGAVAAVSISAVNDGSYSGFTGTFDASNAFSGGVSQAATNGATVTNDAGSIVGFQSLGTGASASVSATGAVTALSVSAVNDLSVSGGSLSLPNVGTVIQTPTNEGAVTNTNAVITVGSLGDGASASAGATGAVASVSVSGINSNLYNGLAGGGFNGGITQTVTNDASVSNYGATVSVGGNAAPAGLFITPQIGNGASVSEASTGAVASVSYSNIDGTTGAQNYAGETSQNVNNTGAVLNGTTAAPNVINAAPPTGQPLLIVGAGASFSVSATGAVASVSESAINGGVAVPGTTYGDVTQTVSNGALISNNGQIYAPQVDFGQAGPPGVAAGGDGASASVSATGAVGSVGFNFVDSTFNGSGTAVSTSDVSQAVTNTAGVGNVGAINIGTLYGTGSSASIGATGAVGSVSFSSTGSVGTNVVAPTFGNVSQTIDNSAGITNSGGIIIAGLNGTASSASVSATGSVASFSVSSIGDQAGLGATTVPSITQSSLNSAPISNTGSITFSPAAVLGVGASASVAATGAVASASFRSVH